ncbi:MAG: aromatic amino acid transport family protein [Patescibacteria group bacterium]
MLIATLTLIGTIIGVGVFGIPYAFAAAGVSIGTAWFLILALAILVIHMYFTEIVLATKEKRRLVGYAKKYLGQKAAAATTVCAILSFYGAIVVYIIVGGEFLYNLFGNILGGGVMVYQIVFFVFTAIFIALGLKLVSKVESVLTALLILTMLVISAAAFWGGDGANFTAPNWLEFFLPYGIIFFALTGSNAIPEMKDIVGGDARALRRSVVIGTVVASVLTFIFTLAVVAVSGILTSPEALKGLGEFLGPKILIFGSIFGFLAIITSFLVIGLNLKEQFIYDFGFGKMVSWTLACVPPLFIFLFGTKNFIKIMGVTGSILSGFIGIIIVAIYLKVVKEKKIKSRLRYFAPLLILLFVFGIIYEIKYLIF